MANFSSSLRSPCSLPNILLTSLNLLLLLLSSASFAPLLLFRTPPSPFGWALLAISSAALLSSLLASYSHLSTTHHHHPLLFVARISLLVVSSIGQAFAFFSLFLCPDATLSFLEPESGRRSKVLMRAEGCAMVGMFVVGSVVLVSECVVESLWVREFEEAEAAASEQRRKRVRKGLKGLSRRTTRVRVESVAENENSGEIDEKMKGKCEEECMMNEV